MDVGLRTFSDFKSRVAAVTAGYSDLPYSEHMDTKWTITVGRTGEGTAVSHKI